MKLNANAENTKTLSAILGIDESEARALLDASVAITFDRRDERAAKFAWHAQLLLSRTIRSVIADKSESNEDVAVELVIGNTVPRFSSPCIYAWGKKEMIVVANAPICAGSFDIHPVGLLLGACYAVGAVLKKALKLPYPSADTLEINLAELVGDDLAELYEPAIFDEAHLAGAGAIGNGFLYGLSQFQVQGRLHVCDDDAVSDGNLQRCLFFTQTDVDLPKADRLCLAAREHLPGVQMFPFKGRLQDFPNRKGSWLKRLIVGVDSPRARRKLQTEIPGAVFDASTTGVSEVVFHFHRQPTDHACLSCVYHESPEEHAHEKHVADAIGVSLDEVRQERISDAAAALICKRYPQLNPAIIAGTAFDTLFKQLCSSAQLKTSEGRQVLAPFAFVSVLGGVYLAIEFIRRLHGSRADLFNEWRISPWSNPVIRRRRKLGRNPDCEFCGDSVLARAAETIWSKTKS
jgi:molybdopterin/thiamine biosynthesis adenylyltransferase